MNKPIPIIILFLLLFPLSMCGQTYIFDFNPVGTHVAGDTINITITATDTSGAPYTSIATLRMTAPERMQCLDVFATPNIIAFNASGTYTGRIIIFRASDSLQLSCSVPIGTAQNNCGYFTILPGSPKKLQILVPGEANDPGNTGNRGRQWVAVFYDTAGVSFNATVYITDEYWNPTNVGNDSVSFGSNNAFPILPPNDALTNGTGQFPFILRTAAIDQTISVSKPNFVGDTLEADTSSPFVVRTGPFSQLLLIAPTQTVLAGDTTTNTFRLPGATPDTADWQVAGTPFNIAVYAVDNCWNPLSGGAPPDTIRAFGTIGPTTLADTSVLSTGVATLTFNSTISGYLYLQATDLEMSSITTQYMTPVYIAGARYRLTADQELDTIISGDPISLHIYYEDESGTIITGDDHDVIIYVYRGSGSLTPTDTIVRALTSGEVHPTVNYTTIQMEELFLEVSSTTRQSTPGRNQNPIWVRPNVTPNEPIVNYPNPFGSDYTTTTIAYYLEQQCEVYAAIYDRFGNLVRKWNLTGARGYNFIMWDGTNNRGTRVANGAYLLAIRATDRTEVIHEYRRWLAVVK
jgi:hypothetical protein